MSFKLAFNNVKKSLKDYTIYFLTLTFGVCLFYVFNSMDSQQAMLDITKSQREILQMLTQVMGVVSVFISVILGFLIIYANKFLIRRRKKELGLYMILGMEKGQISRILITETLFIGLFSLAVGLIIGIFASQGLSVVTAKMLETGISKFYFAFSKTAALKAIVYFGIIFVVVMVFNAFSVSRYKLIDLLSSSKKSENHHIKKLWVSVILFIISIISLGAAYYFIIKNGMLAFDFNFFAAIVLGIIGSLLFFMSLSGFVLRVVKSNKKLYYKGLNIFVLRQINSKINTTYISMTMICLMLLIAIGTLSSGMGMAKALAGDLDALTPYAMSLTRYDYEEGESRIEDRLIEDGIDLEQYGVKTAEYNTYTDTILTYDFMLDYLDKEANLLREIIVNSDMGEKAVPIIALSDYNRALELQGKDSIELKNNEYVINATMDRILSSFNRFLKANVPLMVNGTNLVPATDKVLNSYLDTTTMAMDSGSIIVPDEVIKGLTKDNTILNIQYDTKDAVLNNKIIDLIEGTYSNGENKIIRPYHMMFYKTEVMEQGLGIRLVVSYFVLYIGIIFLITCAAVLALQQLSESSDNIERYRLLGKLGVDRGMMHRSLYTQIFIYFMLPLFLAVIHSVVGLKVANSVIMNFGRVDALGNIIFTVIVMLFIYGGYFVATCLGSRSMIKSKLN